MSETVGSLARLVGGTVHGDATKVIVGVGDLRFAGPDRIGFLRDPKLIDLARQSRIGALLVDCRIDSPVVQVVVTAVDVAFARVASLFHPVPRATEHHVHPSASVHQGAVLEAPVQVAAGVVIDKGARVGAGSVLGAGAVISEDCTVGRACVLHPRVVLYPRVTLGDRVQVHAGAVIGADGFGYARDKDGSWVKWPQLGTVQIDDDVEIGANVTIDRATLGATRIGRGTKIDNLCHIGHNCTLGEHVAIAGFSALSGSVTLGDRVQIGGHVMVGGHIKVAADMRIGGNSVMTNDMPVAGDFMGFPLMEKHRWLRVLGLLSRFPDVVADVRELQRLVSGRGQERHERHERERKERP